MLLWDISRSLTGVDSYLIFCRISCWGIFMVNWAIFLNQRLSFSVRDHKLVFNHARVSHAFPIESLFQKNCDYKVSWNQSNWVAISVAYRIAMMTLLQDWFDICYRVNTLNSDDILAHNVSCSQVLTWSWNLVRNDWHLFAPNSSLIQRSSKHVSNLIRNDNRKDDWHENIDGLWGFHHDYSKGIGHACITRQSCWTTNDDQILS